MINNTKTATASKVTAHQTHAMLLLYTRLPYLSVAPAFAALGIPFIFYFLNLATYGHAVYTAALAGMIWYAGMTAIHTYASTPEGVAKAMGRNEVTLPAIALVFSGLILFLVTRLTGDLLAWYPSALDLLSVFGRVTWSVLLVQLGVFLRYFGPLSMSKLRRDACWAPRVRQERCLLFPHIVYCSTILSFLPPSALLRNALGIQSH